MNNITISRPQSGQHDIVNTTATARYTLDFPSDNATLSRDGNDLVFNFDDDSSIHLSNFYSEYTADNIPDFEVSGTLIAGKDFFSTFAPDLVPAAGQNTQIRTNSGYQLGDAGKLMDGIDHLHELDISFAGETKEDQFLHTEGLLRGDGSSSSTPLHVEPVINYQARAVLYKTDGDASETVGFRLVDMATGGVIDPANPTDVWTVEAPMSGYFSGLSYDADGVCYLTLTPKGLAALQSGENVYEYVKITVNGSSYNMQIVVNQSGDLASADEDARTSTPNSNPSGANESGYEWHTEGNGTGTGDRYACQGNNEVWFSSDEANPTFKGSMTTYDGTDSIYIKNANTAGDGMYGGTVTTGMGDDIVSIDVGNIGMKSDGNASNNTITTGNGQNSFNITANQAMSSSNGGANLIHGAGNTTLTMNENGNSASTSSANNFIDASGAGSSNTIENVEKVIINSDYNSSSMVSANDNGKNTIINSSSVTITGGKQGLFASNNGQNSILNTDGEVVISTDSQGLIAGSGGSNVIDTAHKVEITAANGSSAGGIRTTGAGASNIITNIGESVTIDSAAYGLDARYGSNTISNVGSASNNYKDGTVTISTGNNSVLNASAGGKNEIFNTGDITIESKGSAGLQAKLTVAPPSTGTAPISSNVIHDVGNVTIVGGQNGADGMVAQEYGLNHIYNAESVSITGNTLGGIRAINDASATNLIENINGDVTVSASGYAVTATQGSNTIKNVKDVTLTSTNEVTLKAYSDGKNTIQQADNVTIHGNTKAGILASRGGSNAIQEIAHSVTVDSSGHAVAALDEGSNLIEGVRGQVKLTSNGTDGIGVLATTKSSNKILDVDSLLVESKNKDGISATGANASNTIDEVGSVTINAGNDGIVASFGGTNTVSRAENVNITASENALHAFGNNAKNTVDTVSGDVNLAGKNALSAQNGAENQITNVTQDVNLVTSGSGSSGFGLVAENTGKNTIDIIHGSVSIDAKSNGMNSTTGGSNTITNVDEMVSIKAGIHGMYSSGKNSANTIEQISDGVNIEGKSYGLYADEGKNIIKDIDGPSGVTISAGKYYGIHAGNEGINEIRNVTGNVDVSSVDGYGMYATSRSLNTIVDVKGDISVSGKWALGASEGGANLINGTGKDNVASASDVTIVGKNGAMMSYTGGSNKITNAHDVSLTSEDEHGMYAANQLSANRISNSSGKVEITTSSGSAMAAYDGGLNNIFNNSGDITLTTTGNTHTLSAEKSSANLILDAGANVSIISENGSGVYSDYSRTDLAGIKGNLNIKAKTDGISVSNNSVFSVGLTGKYGAGMDSRNESRINGDVTIEGITGAGVKVGASRLDLQNIDKNLKISGETFGLFAGATSVPSGSSTSYVGSDVFIKGIKQNVEIKANNGIGVEVDASQLNMSNIGGSLQVAGSNGGLILDSKVTPSGASQGSSVVVDNIAKGVNIESSLGKGISLNYSTLEMSNIKDGLTIKSNLTGIDVKNNSSATLNAIAGGINIESAQGSGIEVGNSNLEASNIDSLTIQAKDYGVLSSNGGKAEFELNPGGSVNITANEAALGAKSGGENVISSTGQITVVLTGEAGTLHDAFSMWANGGSSSNIITGGQGSKVTLNGDMHTDNNGTNLINLTGGNAIVEVNGSVTGSNNTISTNGGNNTVVLHATGDASELTLQMGAGGNDVLVLTADSQSAFEASFGSWLTNLLASSGQGGVDAIYIDNSDAYTWATSQSWYDPSLIHIGYWDSATGEVVAGSFAPATFQAATSVMAEDDTAATHHGAAHDGTAAGLYATELDGNRAPDKTHDDDNSELRDYDTNHLNGNHDAVVSSDLFSNDATHDSMSDDGASFKYLSSDSDLPLLEHSDPLLSMASGDEYTTAPLGADSDDTLSAGTTSESYVPASDLLDVLDVSKSDEDSDSLSFGSVDTLLETSKNEQTTGNIQPAPDHSSISDGNAFNPADVSTDAAEVAQDDSHYVEEVQFKILAETSGV